MTNFAHDEGRNQDSRKAVQNEVDGGRNQVSKVDKRDDHVEVEVKRTMMDTDRGKQNVGTY